ncbi:hypothetical protein [Janibacter anophelis]|uniref:hypothetical protein n=1 Tax=Janibacter anophelis TaxID=319054 RepID=UPI000DEEC02A|nr:hypothetical protein [Janibacter anophelis]
MHTSDHLTRASNVGVSKTAADRKTGMTLDELGSLVTKAVRAGVPGDSPIHADLGWSQQVRALHVRPEKRKEQL